MMFRFIFFFFLLFFFFSSRRRHTRFDCDWSSDVCSSDLAYGLSAAFHGAITIENGRAAQKNFDSYPVLRMHEMPVVETVLVPTGDFWGGVGEPTICVVTPALLNAVHAATGKPVRELPLRLA